jgi:hypothetical protein
MSRRQSEAHGVVLHIMSAGWPPGPLESAGSGDRTSVETTAFAHAFEFLDSWKGHVR